MEGVSEVAGGSHKVLHKVLTGDICNPVKVLQELVRREVVVNYVFTALPFPEELEGRSRNVRNVTEGRTDRQKEGVKEEAFWESMESCVHLLGEISNLMTFVVRDRKSCDVDFPRHVKLMNLFHAMGWVMLDYKIWHDVDPKKPLKVRMQEPTYSHVLTFTSRKSGRRDERRTYQRNHTKAFLYDVHQEKRVKERGERYPENLVRVYLAEFLLKDKMVLDPFCCSETLALAAVNTFRKSISIGFNKEVSKQIQEGMDSYKEREEKKSGGPGMTSKFSRKAEKLRERIEQMEWLETLIQKGIHCDYIFTEMPDFTDLCMDVSSEAGQAFYELFMRECFQLLAGISDVLTIVVGDKQYEVFNEYSGEGRPVRYAKAERLIEIAKESHFCVKKMELWLDDTDGTNTEGYGRQGYEEREGGLGFDVILTFQRVYGSGLTEAELQKESIVERITKINKRVLNDNTEVRRLFSRASVPYEAMTTYLLENSKEGQTVIDPFCILYKNNRKSFEFYERAVDLGRKSLHYEQEV